jgi:hypothetical protein
MAATKSAKTGIGPRGRTDAVVMPDVAVTDDIASKGSTGLHFVVSGSLEKPDPELRKFIRSHVMQGKNRGRKLPSRKKKKPRVDQELSASSASPGDLHESLLPPTVTASSPVSTISATLPRSFGSGMSTISFADNLEPGTIEVVLQCELVLAHLYFPHRVLT